MERGEAKWGVGSGLEWDKTVRRRRPRSEFEIIKSTILALGLLQLTRMLAKTCLVSLRNSAPPGLGALEGQAIGTWRLGLC